VVEEVVVVVVVGAMEEGGEAARLTHAAVVHVGVVDPAMRLLDLALQVHGGLGGPAVRHRLVGLGLQVLQRRGDLLAQRPGLQCVPLTPGGLGGENGEKDLALDKYDL